MEKITWSTEKRCIKDLLPADYNPRKLSKEQEKNLRKSLTKFDLVEIPAIDLDGTILAGHMRVATLIDMGRGQEEIDVRVPSRKLTEGEAKEYNLRSNKNTGEWDMEKLMEMPKGLLEDIGWGKDELDDLFESESLQAEEDDFDPEDVLGKSNTIVHLGEVWQLGAHRLMCGDSTKLEDVEKLMDGKKADMVFTDPPYGVSYQSNMRGKGERFDILENDDRFIVEWIPLVASFSTGFIFIWSSWKVVARWIEETEILGDMTNVIIWDKGGGGIGDLKKTFLTDFEMALVWHRGNELKGKRLGSVWSIGKDGSMTYAHPTQKPIELAATAIKNVTDTNSIVLDLFAGSGSTLIACEQTKRICYTMELDPKYCDVVIARWEKLTGERSIKLS